MADVAEAVARRSYGKLLAFLAARHRDVAAAEDALSEAFAAALESWPRTGPPDNPEAWLLTTARRKLIDARRRSRSGAEAMPHLTMLGEELAELAQTGSDIPDRRLALMFTCAHPAIDEAVRAPLMLQTLLGFDAAMIAQAFMVQPAAMGQRLVRAKAKIREAGIPFRVPERFELASRLPPVLDAIYALFTEGWGNPASHRDFTGEGIWLGRLLVELLPDEPEALGLLALMLHAEARKAARRNGMGSFVPLSEQDTSAWNSAMIAEAEENLRRAACFGMAGRFQLEAAIQSAHAARRLNGTTDWTAIERFYTGLMDLSPSPVIAVNHAVALAEAQGFAVGLAALEAAAADHRLSDYQPYWAARARLLEDAGNNAEAHAAYTRAIDLESDVAVQEFLTGKRDRLLH